MSLDHRELAVICFWHVNYEMNKHRDIQVLYWFTVTAPPQINAALFMQHSGEYWLFHINANIAVVFVGYGWNVSRFKKALLRFLRAIGIIFWTKQRKSKITYYCSSKMEGFKQTTPNTEKKHCLSKPTLSIHFVSFLSPVKENWNRSDLISSTYVYIAKKNYANIIFLLPACLFNSSSLSSNAYANKENFTLFLIEKN